MKSGRKSNRSNEAMMVRAGVEPIRIEPGNPELNEFSDAPTTVAGKVKKARPRVPGTAEIDEVSNMRGPQAQPRKSGMRRTGMGRMDSEPTSLMGTEHRRPRRNINLRGNDKS